MARTAPANSAHRRRFAASLRQPPRRRRTPSAEAMRRTMGKMHSRSAMRAISDPLSSKGSVSSPSAEASASNASRLLAARRSKRASCAAGTIRSGRSTSRMPTTSRESPFARTRSPFASVERNSAHAVSASSAHTPLSPWRGSRPETSGKKAMRLGSPRKESSCTCALRAGRASFVTDRDAASCV